MAPPKKNTQFIFDLLEQPDSKKAVYLGDLGLMYELFTEMTKLRQSKRMTQKDLAKEADLPQSYIAKFEAGRTNPTLSQLLKITRALGVKIKLEETDLGPKPEDMD